MSTIIGKTINTEEEFWSLVSENKDGLKVFDFEGCKFNCNIGIFDEGIFSVRFERCKFLKAFLLQAKVKENTSFVGSTFKEEADFWEANFKGGADFSKATFEGKADFWETSFEREAKFWETSFEREAKFSDSTFEGKTDFSEAKFEGKADFWETSFEREAKFWVVNFEGEANFWETNFEGEAKFWDSTFEGKTDFSEAKFEGEADFWKTNFEGEANFSETSFERKAKFWEANFKGEADFSKAKFKREADFWKAKFEKKDDFSEAKFEEEADFSEVNFEGEADFWGAKFKQILDLSKATFNLSLNFNKVGFLGKTFFSETTFKENVLFTDTIIKDDIVFRGTKFEKGLDLSLAVISSQIHSFDIQIDNYTSVDNDTTEIGDFDIKDKNKRETFRILKHHNIKQSNSIDYIEFARLEHAAYASELWKRIKGSRLISSFLWPLKIVGFPFLILSLLIKWLDKKFKLREFFIILSDYLIFSLNRYSNNHGTSYWRGIGFTFIVGWFFFYCSLLTTKGFDYTSFDWEVCKSYFKYYFDFMNPTHRINYLEAETPGAWSYLWDFLGRVFISYGIYQTVQAFRKYKKG